MIGIYIITNKTNNRSYIGQSTNIDKRLVCHKTPKNPRTKEFQEDYEKFGVNGFTYEVLEECTAEQLNEKEKFWIRKLEPFYNKKMYNGRADYLSEEARQQISRSVRKYWDSKPEEEKQKIIKNLKRPLVGHSVSEATRQKLREKNLGKKQSKKTIQKRVEKLRGRKKDNSYRQIKVRCIETKEEFDSIKLAELHFGASTLSQHLKGRYKTCKGLHFEYV